MNSSYDQEMLFQFFENLIKCESQPHSVCLQTCSDIGFVALENGVKLNGCVLLCLYNNRELVRGVAARVQNAFLLFKEKTPFSFLMKCA